MNTLEKKHTENFREHTPCRQDRLEVLWLGWCLNPPAGSLACLEETASSGSVSPITRSLRWSHFYRFQGVSTALGFYVIPQMCPNSRHLPKYSLNS